MATKVPERVRMNSRNLTPHRGDCAAVLTSKNKIKLKACPLMIHG